MRSWSHFLLSLAALAQATPLGLYGATLPISFADPSDTAELFTSLNKTLRDIVHTHKAIGMPFASHETSFSFAVFGPDGTLFQFHHTADKSTLAPDSIDHVDDHTIYRIGSASKLLAVYTFLVTTGWTHIHSPITDYNPVLARRAHECSAADNPVDCIDWSQVTLETLAAQMGGIPRDFEPIDIDPTYTEITMGLLPPSTLTPAEQQCGINRGSCIPQTFDTGLDRQHPVFIPWNQPIYSNAAYQLLAGALEHITNESFPALLQHRVFDRLQMNDSFSSLPPASAPGIIPMNDTISNWNNTFRRGGPEGGMYSSTADLVKLGQSILNHALLSPVQTQRWLKPVGHTASLRMSVGMPWEIMRRSVRPNDTLHSVDLYTKGGDIGAYHSSFALIPAFNMGYILLSAGSGVALLEDALVPQLLEGIDLLAHVQARKHLAGDYTGCGKNSSMTITVQDDADGLNVTEIIVHGQDFLLATAQLGPTGAGEAGYFSAYPSGLKRKTRERTFLESWRVLVNPNIVWQSQEQQELRDTIWEEVAGALWSETTLDELLVETNRDGKVVSITVRVLGESGRFVPAK